MSSGLTYQSAPAVGALAPFVLGYALVYTGTLRTPMTLSVATASAVAILFASGLERGGKVTE